MPDDVRVLRLLEEALGSGRSPDEVCTGSPELLPAVRARWERCRQLEAELDDIFPPASPSSGPEGQDASADTRSVSGPGERDPGLPSIPGYAIEAVLGRGGVGAVYRARHLRLRRPVALKMLLSGAYAGRVERARFLQEARAVAALRHRNVVQVHDVGEHEGRPYFTMELMDGGSLAERLGGAPRPAAEAAALVEAIAGAVEAAHRAGIVHRDLKPANVLLAADGTPKVSDFGLAFLAAMDGEKEFGLTQSGARLGTPSYMAPEQAAGGRRGSVGPAADVYALGAVLYETLTGRPPFRGESAAETERQVIEQDAVAPSRLNGKVPRDLETICLKCLQKDPKRRYDSAAALAEDLRRFQRGEPIAARPARWPERLWKWTRRRPGLAASLVGVLLATGVLAGGGVWLASRRAEMLRVVDGHLVEMARLQEASAWPAAAAALDRARTQLGDGGPAELRGRLDQGERDLALVERLDAIRMKRSVVVSGRFRVRDNIAAADRENEEAFSAAGFGRVFDDPRVVAERIRASNIRGALVTVLDDWTCSAAATDPRRHAWLLDVARRADANPTPWQNRFRDTSTWQNRATLLELAGSAFEARPTADLLVALARRLDETGADPIPFMRRVQQAHPGDFWANFTLGDALAKAKPEEAVRYYQAAVALRPDASVAHNNLGIALAAIGRPDESIGQFAQALRIHPDFADAHYNLALVLKAVARFDEAIDHLSHALRIDPGDAEARYNLGLALRATGRPAEAIDAYEQVLAVDAEHADAHYNLGLALNDAKQPARAVAHFMEALRITPGHPHAYYNMGLAQAAIGRTADAIAAFEGAIRLDPNSAEAHYNLGLALKTEGRTPEAVEHLGLALRGMPDDPHVHYNLGLALNDAGRPSEAAERFRRTLQIDPRYAAAQGSLGDVLLGQGQFEQAQEAMRSCLALTPAGRARDLVAEQLARCGRLVELEARLTDAIAGADQLEPAECLEFARLCRIRKDYGSAARFFASAFARAPALAEDVGAGRRYEAARVAALAARTAGGGSGPGAAPGGHTPWGLQAARWLRADVAAWSAALDGDRTVDPEALRRTLTGWRFDPDLEGLRDQSAVDKLPADHRTEYAELWSEVSALLGRVSARGNR